MVGREPVHAYERPVLSKAFMTDGQYEPVHPFTLGRLAAHGIEVRVGTEVEQICRDEREVMLANGQRLAYGRLLLAVGSRPRRLAGTGAVDVMYLRTHEDACRISRCLVPGRHVGVVGAGLIGLELAAAARQRGCEVTVIEAGQHALGRVVPPGAADDIVALHEKHTVDFRWGVTVQALAADDRRTLMALSSGETLSFDVVIVGIGAEPNIELAASAGLAVEDGIAVDQFLRTADTNIYAAGDCAAVPHRLARGRRLRLESWRSALEQAVTVAANMVGEHRVHTGIPWLWSEFYDHSLQAAGLQAFAEDWTDRRRSDGVRLRFGLDRRSRLVYAVGFGRGNAVARDIKIAERIIARDEPVDPVRLADAGCPLRTLAA